MDAVSGVMFEVLGCTALDGNTGLLYGKRASERQGKQYGAYHWRLPAISAEQGHHRYIVEDRKQH